MRAAIRWLAFAVLAYLVLDWIALGHLEYAMGWPLPVRGNGLFMGVPSGQGRDQ